MIVDTLRGNRAKQLTPEIMADVKSMLALNCDSFDMLPHIQKTYNVNLTCKDLRNIKQMTKQKTKSENNAELIQVIDLLKEYGEYLHINYNVR